MTDVMVGSLSFVYWYERELTTHSKQAERIDDTLLRVDSIMENRKKK